MKQFEPCQRSIELRNNLAVQSGIPTRGDAEIMTKTFVRPLLAATLACTLAFSPALLTYAQEPQAPARTRTDDKCRAERVARRRKIQIHEGTKAAPEPIRPV